MAEVTVNTRTVHLDVAVDLKNKDDKHRFNYIVEIQKLVAQILTELGRISANDHESIERMKHKYMEASLKNAALQGELGKANRNIGFVAFGVMCARLFMPNADDQAIIGILSNQTEHLAGLYTAGYQSEMQKTSAESQLELEKYRTKTASKQSDGSTRQDYMSLLQAVGENQRSASRAGG